MKKIAIITAGLLPLPDVKGGAIETLLEYTLEQNEIEKKFEFEVFSIYDETAIDKSKNFKKTSFIYININKTINRIIKIFFKILRKCKINKDPNFQILFIRKVYKKLKKKNYDYIIVESDKNFTNYLLKRNINPKVILYLHNDKLNKDSRNAKFILQNVYKVFCVSSYIKNQVLTIDNSCAEKVRVIMNGVEFNKNIKLSPHNNVNFLFTGRIDKEKGVLELVKAFNKANNPNNRLYIAGGAFYSSNKLTKYLKKVLNEINKNKNIIYLGYVNHDEISKLYEKIDAQIVPSIWQEPCALVNIEALCYGINLIATDVGGTREIVSYVKPNEGIFLIRNDEYIIDNLCEAINKIKKLDKKIDRNVDELTKNKYCERYFNELEML